MKNTSTNAHLKQVYSVPKNTAVGIIHDPVKLCQIGGLWWESLSAHYSIDPIDFHNHIIE